MLLHLLFPLFLGLFAPFAYAQNALTTLGLNPERIGQDIYDLIEPIPSEEPLAPLHNKNLHVPARHDSFQHIRFLLQGISFQGNTIFSEQELRVFFQDYYNKEISVQKLAECVEKITEFYEHILAQDFFTAYQKIKLFKIIRKNIFGHIYLIVKIKKYIGF